MKNHLKNLYLYITGSKKPTEELIKKLQKIFFFKLLFGVFSFLFSSQILVTTIAIILVLISTIGLLTTLFKPKSKFFIWYQNNYLLQQIYGGFLLVFIIILLLILEIILFVTKS